MSSVDTGVVKFNTKLFMQPREVKSAMERAEFRALSKLGRFTYTAARRSIRRRKKKISAPGDPPFDHTTKGSFASLKTILYVYNKNRSSVVIGPVKLNSSKLGQSTAHTVPQLLEEGGRVTQTKKSRSGKGTYQKQYVVAARPFMGPAKTKAIEDVDKAMENTFY